MKTVSDKVVGHSLSYLFVRKWLVRDVAFYTWKFGEYWPTPCTTPIFNLFSLVAPQP